MPEHVQYEDDDLFNPETHHEESDVPLKPLWVAAILFVVLGAVTHFVLYGMYDAMLEAEKNRMDPPQTAVPRPASADVPQNQPLLQPFPTVAVPYRNTPVTDLRDMRAAEDKALHTYGWVDKEQGVVHIPIDTAKEMLAAQMQGSAGVSPAGTAASSPPGSFLPPTEIAVPPPATHTGGTH